MKTQRIYSGALLGFVGLLLAGCGGGDTLRPDGQTRVPAPAPRAQTGPRPRQDGPPVPHSIPADVANVPDAIPRPEPLSVMGNPDVYEVLGQKYYVLASSRGFTDEGIASWYGRKFHGQSTSNGESYDMFGMTAAHKTLPLPSYVRVTNLENGRQAVVRVNDRGPFHDGRIIDLSYAAAARLDVLANGTAPVRIEALEGGAQDSNALPLYLQIGAYGEPGNAQRVVDRVAALGLSSVFISPSGAARPLYRVRLGPYPDAQTALQARNTLERNGFSVSSLRY